jgi:hypothetical protein
MDNDLIRLKKVLDGIDDEDLKEMDLYIDCDSGVQMIAIEENAITLVTDTHKLKINDKEW